MSIHILKFGGTSMNNHHTWKNVLEIIKSYEQPVVVVSATARTTRRLLEAGTLTAAGKTSEASAISADIRQRHIDIIEFFLDENPHPKNELIRKSCLKKIEEITGKLNKLLQYIGKHKSFSPQMKDAVASLGEQLSSYLLAQCGLALNMQTQHVEARKLIKTDAQYGSASPNLPLIIQKCGSLETVMKSGFIPIIGGFYGEAPNGTVTTLGFEGSDYTASLLGHALNASAIEIWTDVSGIYSCDPRVIAKAKPIAELSYEEATEMAWYGAKVLHPATLKPARGKDIPVKVKNIFDPGAAGTVISARASGNDRVLAMAIKTETALLTIHAGETLMGTAFLSRVFALLQKHLVPVDAIQTTEASITLALAETLAGEALLSDLQQTGETKLSGGKAIISLIGCRIPAAQQLTETVFRAAATVDLISFSHEKKLLSLVLDEQFVTDTAKNIYDSVFG